MIVPVWKIKREAIRVAMQIMIGPWLLISPLLRLSFDKLSDWLVRFHQGHLVVSENVAILLIFQQKGIQKSTFHTLRHLRDHGFSPIVVANHKLDNSDLVLLKELSSAVIERPNYGYDFGGYRQGILYLLKMGYTPENLLVLNDSIWFPVNETDLLTEVKNQEKQLFGLVMNDVHKRRTKHHVQSYFFNFKRDVITSQAFAKYWKNLFLSNNKLAVIRLCEMRMTDYFRKAGFSVGSKYTVEDLYSAMRQATESQLDKIVSYQMLVDPKRAEEIQRRKPEGLRRLIDERLLGKYFLIAHPIILLGILKCPIMKKDKQFVYRVQRSELFKEKLGPHIYKDVRAEMMMYLEDPVFADEVERSPFRKLEVKSSDLP